MEIYINDTSFKSAFESAFLGATDFGKIILDFQVLVSTMMNQKIAVFFDENIYNWIENNKNNWESQGNEYLTKKMRQLFRNPKIESCEISSISNTYLYLQDGYNNYQTELLTTNILTEICKKNSLYGEQDRYVINLPNSKYASRNYIPIIQIDEPNKPIFHHLSCWENQLNIETFLFFETKIKAYLIEKERLHIFDEMKEKYTEKQISFSWETWEIDKNNLISLFPFIEVSDLLVEKWDTFYKEYTAEKKGTSEKKEYTSGKTESIAMYKRMAHFIAILNGWQKEDRLSQLNDRTVYAHQYDSDFYISVDTQHGDFEIHIKKNAKNHLGSIRFDRIIKPPKSHTLKF